MVADYIVLTLHSKRDSVYFAHDFSFPKPIVTNNISLRDFKFFIFKVSNVRSILLEHCASPVKRNFWRERDTHTHTHTHTQKKR